VKQLYEKLDRAIAGYTDKESKLHVSDVCTRLKVALDFQKKNYPEAETRMNSSGNTNGFNVEEINNPFNILLSNGYKNLNKCCWEENERKQPWNR
jgi:hypothetical protein